MVCTCGITFLADDYSRACLLEQPVCGPDMAVCTVCILAGRSCTLCSTSAGYCPNIKGTVQKRTSGSSAVALQVQAVPKSPTFDECTPAFELVVEHG